MNNSQIIKEHTVISRVTVRNPPMEMNTSPTYTKYVGYIPETVTEANPIFRAMLTVRTGQVLENELDGHQQGFDGTVRYPIVDIHNPEYSNADTKNAFGISYHDVPYNRPKNGDIYDRVITYSSDAEVVAVGDRRTLTNVYIGEGASGGGILLNLWDEETGTGEYAVQEDDIGKTVYMSRTYSDADNNIDVTGKAGYGCISKNSSVGKIEVGKIMSIPQVGDNKAWIHLTGAKWIATPGVE